MVCNTHLDDQGIVSRRESAALILRCIRRFALEWAVEGVVLVGDFNSEATTTTTTTTTTTAAVAAAADADDDGAAAEIGSGDAWSIFSGRGSGIKDLRSLVSRAERYGSEMTFTGFDGNGEGERCRRIDFVFVGVHADEDEDEDERTGTGGGEGDGDESAGAPGGGGGRRRRQENRARSSVEGDDNDTSEQTTRQEQKGLRKEEKSPWQIEGYAVLPNLFDDGIYLSDHRAVVGDLVLK